MRKSPLGAAFLTRTLLKCVVAVAAAVILYVVPSAVIAANQLPPTFTTEAAAQKHCPRDEVVWLNIPTGIYHEKGMRWYGRTKSGAFVCKKEADAAGDRDTRNGQ